MIKSSGHFQTVITHSILNIIRSELYSHKVRSSLFKFLYSEWLKLLSYARKTTSKKNMQKFDFGVAFCQIKSLFFINKNILKIICHG